MLLRSQESPVNDQLQAFARQTLEDGLSRVLPRSQEFFKLMYGKVPGQRRLRSRTPAMIEYIKQLPIDTVVDQMNVDDLDWAMQQVARTLEKQQ